MALTGSQAVTPATTTTYTLTATHGTQTATANATVTVNGASGSGLPGSSASRQTRLPSITGRAQSLQWVVENATTVTIDNSIGTVGLTGSHSISPATTTSYTITASNANGTVSATTTLTVITSVQIISFTATPSTVLSGGTSILVCETKGAVSVNVNGITFNTSTAVASVHVTADDHVQLHGYGGERPDGFGADYSDCDRADRSLIEGLNRQQRKGRSGYPACPCFADEERTIRDRGSAFYGCVCAPALLWCVSFHPVSSRTNAA